MISLAAAAIAGGASGVCAQTIPAGQGRVWNPTFADEFNTGASDLAGWTYDIGNGQNGWGNNELENYTNSSNNSFVSNGALTIRRDRHAGRAERQLHLGDASGRQTCFPRPTD